MSNISQIRREINQEVFDYQGLLQCLSAYAKPRDKIGRLLTAGDIVRVKKGLYVFGEAFRRAPVSRELLANLIYGPSYVSMDYALAWYGLIPERVSTVTSATATRSRQFTTPFGVFSYRALAGPRYAVGAALEQTGGQSFLIASPEKAIVDKVWTDKRFPGTALSDYGPYLEDDLRIDTERLRSLDWQRLEIVRAAYGSPKIDRLVRHLQAYRETEDA